MSNFNKLVWLIIVLALVLGFYSITNAMALHNTTSIYKYAGCHQYAHSTYSSKDGVAHVSFLQYGDCAKTAKNDNGQPSQPVVTIIATESPVVPVVTVVVDPSVTSTPESPVVPVVTETPKVHCNNGEGNGGEGCSPAKSINANNDENQTSPSEDKSNK